MATRRSVRHAGPADESSVELKRELGRRLRAARQRAGLLQRELAGDRFTAAYVSAIEKGLVQPTIAACLYFAERLGVDARDLLSDRDRTWRRLQADVALASGRWEAALTAYDDLLSEGLTSSGQAEVLRGRAEALCRLGRGSDAIRPAAEAAAQFERARREGDALEARYWLAYGHYLSENLTEARSIAIDVLQRARGRSDPPTDLISRVLVALSHIESWTGEYSQALTYLEEARAGIDGLDARRRASFLFSLAVSYRDAGDMEAAIRAATESLAYFSAANEEGHVASLENNLALAHLRLGHTQRAWEFATSARDRAERLGDHRLLAHIAESEAQVAVAQGRLSEAAHLLDEAGRLADETDNHAAQLSVSVTRAALLRRMGDLGNALNTYRRSVDLARSIAAPSRRREILREYADTALEAGNQQLAISLYRQGLETD